MKTAQTLMLAAFVALSLGVGTAMAQEGPSMIPSNDYWTLRERALYAHPAQAQAPVAAPVQSGSSDVERGLPGLDSGWVGDNAPYRFNYSTLANPG